MSDLKDEVGDNRGAVSSEDQSFEDYNFESGIHPDINFLLFISGIDLQVRLALMVLTEVRVCLVKVGAKI